MRFEQRKTQESPWRSGEGSREGEEPVQIPQGSTGLARRLRGSRKRGKWGRDEDAQRGEGKDERDVRAGSHRGPSEKLQESVKQKGV